MCFALSSCAKPQDNQSPSGAHSSVYGVPKIDSFPTDKLQPYELQFSEVSCACYHHDNMEESISADDSRIMQLLNFIAYSENNSTKWMIKGYVDSTEAADWYHHFPYLEVFFCDDNPHDDTLGVLSKIIVVRGTVFMFELDGRIEAHWPYMALYVENAGEEDYMKEMSFSDDLSNSPWLDILTYCGF